MYAAFFLLNINIMFLNDTPSNSQALFGQSVSFSSNNNRPHVDQVFQPFYYPLASVLLHWKQGKK